MRLLVEGGDLGKITQSSSIYRLKKTPRYLVIQDTKISNLSVSIGPNKCCQLLLLQQKFDCFRCPKDIDYYNSVLGQMAIRNHGTKRPVPRSTFPIIPREAMGGRAAGVLGGVVKIPNGPIL